MVHFCAKRLRVRLAYSIWHIFRIEDIVAHEMIAEDSQILFTHDFHNRIGAPIITTGNELQGNEIAELSEKLNINDLYLYVKSCKGIYGSDS